jgi:hypothetical protein
MIYSLPYIALVVVFGILSIYYQSNEEEKIRSNITLSCFAILIFFFGFRGFIGTDWVSYYTNFNDCDWSDLSLNPFGSDVSWHIEPIFTFLMLSCKTFGGDFQIFVFICCLIDEILLFRFLMKRSDNIPLAIMIFVCMGGLVMQTNLMRNSISILLFINALDYLENRKPVPYFIICIVALYIHTSSILFFPLYFFFHRKCNKWVYLGIFILGNVILLLHVKTISPLLSLVSDSGDKISTMLGAYTDEHFGDMNFKISIGYLERLMTGILIFCYYEKLIIDRKENIVFINAFIGYFCMNFFFSEFTVMSDRLGGLFIFCYWIIWPDLLKCFSIVDNRKLFTVFLTIYCVLKINGMTNLIGLEYDNVLLGAKSYQERLYINNKDNSDLKK